MSKGGNEAAGPLDRSASHLMHRALQRALDIYGEIAGGVDLTQRQYAVLAAVGMAEGVTQAGLVKSTGIDRSTLADLVSRMIDKGLLARERSNADARANAVRLTEPGRALLEEAAPRAQGVDDAILALLPKSRRVAFLDALETVAAGRKRGKAAKKERKIAKKARKQARKTAVTVVEDAA
jgi:DNA-binding MarR family transcriptional regulator